jgi:hypothetical protein
LDSGRREQASDDGPGKRYCYDLADCHCDCGYGYGHDCNICLAVLGRKIQLEVGTIELELGAARMSVVQGNL